MTELSLDSIGVLQGTDKSSLVHGYLAAYERVLRDLRGQSFNLIEIGVLDGASVRTWSRYFPEARIIGVDINPACRVHAGPGIVIEIGSQDDPEFLARLCAQYPPTVIIDDGSHQADHILFTLDRMFPSLLPGGTYIIEDLHFHGVAGSRLAAMYAGKGQTNPIDTCMSAARRLMVEHRVPPEAHGFERYLLESLDSVTFVNRAAILRKRRRPDADAALIALADSAGTALTAAEWDRLSSVLLQRDCPPSQAEAASRHAIALAPDSGRFRMNLAEALGRQGRQAEQLAAALAGAELDPDRAHHWDYLAMVHHVMGSLGEADEAMRKALALAPEDGMVRIHNADLLASLGRRAEALAEARVAAALLKGTNLEAHAASRLAALDENKS